MAADMLVHTLRDNCDVVILVSGDNDFADAVQAVKDAGKHVEVALFGGSRSSQQLRDVADRVVEIAAAFLNSCWQL